MADFLVYWKDFWRDVSNEPAAIGFFWQTSKKSFYEKAQPNGRLWVVISAGKHGKEWRLLQRIVVRDKVMNRGSQRAYEMVGSRKRSQQFDIEIQPDYTKLLRTLQFATGKKIRVSGRAIGKRLQAIRRLSVSDSELLDDYSQRLGGRALDDGFSDLEESIKTCGAGFGDPETNRRVETAAVSFVRRLYESRGWKVRSVEREKIGFDLRCVKGSSEEHVEVKGVQGGTPRFIITAGELRRAKNDPGFVLFVVLSALTHPSSLRYSGKEFVVSFSLKSLAFQAALLG